MSLGKHCPALSFPSSKRPVRLHFIVAELQHLIIFCRALHLFWSYHTPNHGMNSHKSRSELREVMLTSAGQTQEVVAHTARPKEGMIDARLCRRESRTGQS